MRDGTVYNTTPTLSRTQVVWRSDVSKQINIWEIHHDQDLGAVWFKVARCEEQTDWRSEMWQHSWKRWALLCEASQKNMCRWLLKVTTPNNCTDMTMTCSLCSHPSICYAWIFSRAFQMRTRRRFTPNECMGTFSTATACCMTFRCEDGTGRVWKQLGRSRTHLTAYVYRKKVEKRKKKRSYMFNNNDEIY